MTTPRVSIAIPLYRSQRFLPIIMRNVDSIAEPDAEILISDRHGDDDATEVLRRRYEGDSRVRVMAARDRLHWVDHYNELLRQARGDYFMWMPHDDSFPADYIPLLAESLDRDRDARLAFGVIDAVDLSGAPLPGWVFHAPPFAGRSEWNATDALRVLFWGTGIPFRGLFRRAPVVSSGHFIRTHASGADGFWIFGLALQGPLRFVPACRCTKRYYPDSTCATTPFGADDVLVASRVLRSYLRDAPLRWRERAQVGAGLQAWIALQLTGRLLPSNVRPAGYRLGYRLLPAAWRPSQRRFESREAPFDAPTR